VRHVGYFPALEDELSGFGTMGYTGNNSPNRADALVWALTALFPALTKPTKIVKLPTYNHNITPNNWMSR
jgi:phage terminase large subunit-like protein